MSPSCVWLCNPMDGSPPGSSVHFFDDPADVDNLISGSSAFSKTSLNIWKFTVHVLLKPGLENFEHYFASVWDECNCVVVWAFFGIAFLCDWNENWPFTMLSFRLWTGKLIERKKVKLLSRVWLFATPWTVVKNDFQATRWPSTSGS